jgi:Protein of unknown function (DUF2950)
MARPISIQRLFALTGLFTVLLLVVLGRSATGQNEAGLAGKPRSFNTADEAAAALVRAAETYDVQSLNDIFGPNSNDVINTGEPGHDKAIAEEFVAQARTKMDVILDPKNRRRAIVTIGNENWPFAIPIIRQASGKWAFDTNQGRQELLFRRIGRNEIDAIDICLGFVEAQHRYALTKHDGAKVNQFAQRIISTSGKQDGLAWQNGDGTWGGSIGERAAKALEGAIQGAPSPFHGYYFKVLKGQGPAAPLGQLDYVHDGAMIGGFALIAYPAMYQITGVKSFMVSQDGVVYEKDMGPNTADVVKTIERFNPDRSWRPIAKSN